MDTQFVEVTQSDMYQLDKPEVIDRTKLKSDYVSYRPTSLAGVNGTAPFNIIIPREDVFADLRDSYLEIETKVSHVDGTLYANGDNIQPNTLFGISLFREMSLSSFGSKKLEHIEQVYLSSLMYKLLSDNEEDMMIIYKKDGFDVVDTTKRDRMLNDTDEKGTIFVRVYLKDVFGFVRHLDKINYGLGYTLTMKRALSGNSIFRGVVANALVEVKDIVWYVRHDTPSFDNIALVNEHILAKKTTDYSYVSRMVSTKPVNSNNRWTMEIGTESGTDVPIYLIVGFQSTNKFNADQAHSNGIFDRLDVTEASCHIGTTRYPDTEYSIDFDRNKYNDAYNEVRRFYKDYIKGEGSPYITFKEFKEIYNLWVFDLRAQKQNPSAQPIKVNFTFRAGFNATAGNYQAIALVLTQKIVSVSSDGQRQFDIL